MQRPLNEGLCTSDGMDPKPEKARSHISEEPCQMFYKMGNDSRGASRHAPHILVVEDEHTIARFIEMELLQEQYSVTVVQDGISALLFIRQHHPDLVILDLMLPNIDGLEVCRRLRATGTQQHLPVLIL